MFQNWHDLWWHWSIWMGFNNNQYTNPKWEFINLQREFKGSISLSGLFFNTVLNSTECWNSGAECWGYRDTIDTGLDLWELPYLCVLAMGDTFLFWSHIAWETKSQLEAACWGWDKNKGGWLGGWLPGNFGKLWARLYLVGKLDPGVELAQPLFPGVSFAAQHCHCWPWCSLHFNGCPQSPAGPFSAEACSILWKIPPRSGSWTVC